MNDKEFIDKNCSRCANKNEMEKCEIRENIAGEPQCINMKLVSTDGVNYKFEEVK